MMPGVKVDPHTQWFGRWKIWTPGLWSYARSCLYWDTASRRPPNCGNARRRTLVAPMMKVSPIRPVPLRSDLIMFRSSCDRGSVDSGLKCLRFFLLGFAMGVTQGVFRMVTSSSVSLLSWGRVGVCAMVWSMTRPGGGLTSSSVTRRL